MKNALIKLASTAAVVATLVVGSMVPSFAADSRTGHVTQSGEKLAQIATAEQAVAFANIQNLAARWNNIITVANTGEDQLKLMRESGVFADEFTINFHLPDGNTISLASLGSDEAKGFYNQVVNGLKKKRANAVANVEWLGETDGTFEARFRYMVFMGDRYSLGGVNKIDVQLRDGRYQIVSSDIFVERFATQHAY